MKPFLALLMIPLLGFTLLHAQKKRHEIPKPYELADYNFVVGTQMIGAKYKFTKDSYLEEQARQIRGMGSNILKITLGKNYANSYPDLQADPSVRSTVDVIKTQREIRKVLDMDFKYIFLWVHTLTAVKWQKPMSPGDRLKIYQEMYDLTEYLLTEYNGTDKVFLLGNWEGDWLLHGLGKRNIEPSDEKIAAMTEWFKLRQLAIDDAKKAVAHSGVEVLYYVEVNLVKKGLEGEKCITESMLEAVNPDLVSYSSYESIKKHPNYESLKATLSELMDYMESKLQPKDGIPFERRVFIGEYGYGMRANSAEKQSNLSKQVMMAALELRLPFALHWEMYNNEYTPNGDSKGMSLISEAGERKPVYYLHSQFYETMNQYLLDHKEAHDAYPEPADFRAKALETLKGL